MSECAAVAKRKWKRWARPRSRHVVFSISFVNCPPAKFRSMSMERTPRRSGADKAFSKFWDCLRKSFRRCRNLRMRKSSRFDKKIRSEEHTSELQSQSHIVCRLLLEKKK